MAHDSVSGAQNRSDYGGKCSELETSIDCIITIIFLFIQTSFPLKIEALHIVNQSYIFDIIFNIFRPFLDDKMKERIFFHGDDRDSLHRHIDAKYLPERYGGIHPDYNYNDWIDNLRSNQKVVDELKGLGYTDSEETEQNSTIGDNC